MTYLSSLQSSSLPFSIAQIIPGTVIGPSEFCRTSREAKARMDRQTKALLFDDQAPRYAFGFVHVEDCARVHVEALDEVQVPSEQLPRWFVAAGTVEERVTGEQVWGRAADVVERDFSREVEEGVFRVGRKRVPINMPFRVDSRVTENMLMGGKRIRGLEECIREVGRWYLGLKRGEEDFGVGRR
jgi:nucleoside-diphosphate-sugar epimerase